MLRRRAECLAPLLQGIGFKYRDHQVIVELDILDNMEGVPLPCKQTLLSYLNLPLCLRVHMLHAQLQLQIVVASACSCQACPPCVNNMSPCRTAVMPATMQ